MGPVYPDPADAPQRAPAPLYTGQALPRALSSPQAQRHRSPGSPQVTLFLQLFGATFLPGDYRAKNTEAGQGARCEKEPPSPSGRPSPTWQPLLRAWWAGGAGPLRGAERKWPQRQWVGERGRAGWGEGGALSLSETTACFRGKEQRSRLHCGLLQSALSPGYPNYYYKAAIVPRFQRETEVACPPPMQLLSDRI